jgi:hypothetical protein
MPFLRRALGRSLAAAALVAAAACGDEFLTVETPNVIDAGSVDPVQDATTLANSGQQNFAAALGWFIMYQSWFTGETLVSETFPTRNEYGFRAVSAANGSHNGEVWFPLSQTAASTKLVIDLELPDADRNINYVRSHVWRGYAFLYMAEMFCEGTVSSGPRLTTAAMLDSAVAQFTVAITKGTANGSAAAVQLANVARVGRARAHLQAGRKPQAAADAISVPAGFVFNFLFVDDPGNRNRLSNRLWQFTFDRGSMSVAPAYRVTDPRIRYRAPGQHTLQAQDANAGPFFIQDKYPAFTSPVRVASKLEADYIAAEAGTTTEQLALINARRAANNQPAYAGGTDATAVLAELMLQKSLDFWLEGKKMGDFRRNGAAVPFVPATGATYFKPGFPPIGNQTCWPLPINETDNNPNFRTQG